MYDIFTTIFYELVIIQTILLIICDKVKELGILYMSQKIEMRFPHSSILVILQFLIPK